MTTPLLDPQASVTPASLRQVGERELEIVWKDGHTSRYDVVALRRACPCAVCVDEVTGKRVLKPEDVAEEVKPRQLKPVGRYAIQFEWSDGHDTGIYSFDLLRKLCPCSECSARRERDADVNTGGTRSS